ERAKARREMIEYRGGKRGQRTRARERETSRCTRLAVQFLTEAGNERATVCHVDVVCARRKRCLRDAIVLSLERPRAVNDDLRRSRAKSRSKIGSGEVELQIAAGPAPRRENFDLCIGGERPGNADAEISPAADDNDPCGRHAGD